MSSRFATLAHAMSSTTTTAPYRSEQHGPHRADQLSRSGTTSASRPLFVGGYSRARSLMIADMSRRRGRRRVAPGLSRATTFSQ